MLLNFKYPRAKSLSRLKKTTSQRQKVPSTATTFTNIYIRNKIASKNGETETVSRALSVIKTSNRQKVSEKHTSNREASNIVLRKWEIKMLTSSILVYTVLKALTNTINQKIDKCYKLLEWRLNYGYLQLFNSLLRKSKRINWKASKTKCLYIKICIL